VAPRDFTCIRTRRPRNGGIRNFGSTQADDFDFRLLSWKPFGPESRQAAASPLWGGVVIVGNTGGKDAGPWPRFWSAIRVKKRARSAQSCALSSPM